MQYYEKPLCPRCFSDANIVEFKFFFKCAFCGSIIKKNGQLTLEDFIR